MSNFEKLLMVVVPFSGGALILYFFTLYLPDVQQGNFYEDQRLQGGSYARSSDIKSSKNEAFKPKIIQKQTLQKNYITWQSDKTIKYVPQSLKNQKYKQTRQQPSYIYPVDTFQSQPSYNAKQKYQQQLQNRKYKQHQKKVNDQECSYYEQMKEKIRDRMRRKYKASEYNRLEKRRKHWAKLYADNCFSGYRYPR